MGISTKLVSEFTHATDTPKRRDALAKLIKTKQLHEAVTKESFRHGLEQLASSVRNEPSDVDRLLTVAALLHAAATAPSIRASVESLVRDTIVEPLSKLSELPDVHDRLHAARSWRVAPKSWPGDLATAAAHEESGEAVRRECIASLSSRPSKRPSPPCEGAGDCRFETRSRATWGVGIACSWH